jgi:sterol 3beta-glucosyltransferase
MVGRAGLPSVVVPYFADQFGWGERLHQLGVSPKPIPRKRLTAESLENATTIAVNDPGMRQKAAELGLKIRSENGLEQAIAIFSGSISFGLLRHPQ